MRFSVLLPTRNGGAFLQHCLLSILSQNHSDFELVVSDNANTDSTAQVLEEFSTDSRLIVLRQPEVLSVVDNWNCVLEASTGEYLLVLGDDDYLLPNALQRLEQVINTNQHPDWILYNGYSYTAPNTFGTDQKSYWAKWHHVYGSDFIGDKALTKEHRDSIVFDMFRFVQRIPLNIQTMVFSRESMQKATGLRFRPPFPDHFLLNALLLSASKCLYLPERLVVVGASPKSFGHFFYGQNSDAGLEYLKIKTNFPGALPGNELLNGMYSWLLALKSTFSEELKTVEIDHGGYILRQIYFWLGKWRGGFLDSSQFFTLVSKLDFNSWWQLARKLFSASTLKRAWASLSSLKDKSSNAWTGLQPLEDIDNIREFALWVTDAKRHETS